MGIELNIWERAKVGIHFNYFVDVNYDNYTNYLYCRYASILCTVWWGAEASIAVSMPLITARSSTGTLVLWVHNLSTLCCQTNLLGFCLSFTLVDLKLWNLDLPALPDHRSQFDVHGTLEDNKVKQLEYTFVMEYIWCTLDICYYINYINFVYYAD